MPTKKLSALPPELRLVIYSHLLSFDHPIGPLNYNTQRLNVSILYVDKEIYAEALDVLYALNTISLDFENFCISHPCLTSSAPSLRKWLDSLPYRVLQIGLGKPGWYCDARCLLDPLTKNLDGPASGKLKEAMVNRNWLEQKDIEYLRSTLRDQGRSINFPAVGCCSFSLTPARSTESLTADNRAKAIRSTTSPVVEMVYPELCDAWDIMSRIPPPQLAHWRAPRDSMGLYNINRRYPRLLSALTEFLQDFYAGKGVADEARASAGSARRKSLSMGAEERTSMEVQVYTQRVAAFRRHHTIR